SFTARFLETLCVNVFGWSPHSLCEHNSLHHCSIPSPLASRFRSSRACHIAQDRWSLTRLHEQTNDCPLGLLYPEYTLIPRLCGRPHRLATLKHGANFQNGARREG